MKKLILISLFLSIASLAYSQEQNTVMIKSVETYGSFSSIKKELYIINEKGESKITELEKHNSKGIPENMLVLKNTLDDFLKKGFEIISSDAVSFGWNGVFTIEHTYYLRKK